MRNKKAKKENIRKMQKPEINKRKEIFKKQCE